MVYFSCISRSLFGIPGDTKLKDMILSVILNSESYIVYNIEKALIKSFTFIKHPIFSNVSFIGLFKFLSWPCLVGITDYNVSLEIQRKSVACKFRKSFPLHIRLQMWYSHEEASIHHYKIHVIGGQLDE